MQNSSGIEYPKPLSYPKVLSIAGSDSGGASGIQADIKTISAIGCYATTVITAITAQNSMGITSVQGIPTEMVNKQLSAVLDDIGTDAIKTGMLYSTETVRAVALRLAQLEQPNIVVDPVLIATSGTKLIDEAAIKAYKEVLFPLATIITPNLPEAEVLLERKINTRDEMLQAAEDLLNFGCQAVLLKGGHGEESELMDILVEKDNKAPLLLLHHRIASSNTRGTGCTMASAIASYLAKGLSIRKATELAASYIQQAIQHGLHFRTGNGKGPLNHLFAPEILRDKHEH